MFYLFKNSSLSQLSQLGWNIWPELNLYQVRSDWQCWQWKIGSNKAIDPVLAWYCWHCIYQGRARHWALQHRNTGGKLSSYGRTKTFFKKLPLKISCEGQELWLLTISIGTRPSGDKPGQVSDRARLFLLAETPQNRTEQNRYSRS